ncbi:MAG: hypothetical protein LBT38_07250, partial [Deltaproteobacteria bacterium]|nr:hypothetical protein [Deltaproteobacteria bacterium]
TYRPLYGAFDQFPLILDVLGEDFLKILVFFALAVKILGLARFAHIFTTVLDSGFLGWSKDFDH